MSAENRRYLVVFVILLVSAFVIINLARINSGVTADIDLAKLPLEIGGWKGEDLDVFDDVYEILGTKDLIMREYIDKQGDSLVLAIVYSNKDRQSLHPPEYCYLGGGVELLDKSKEDVLLKGNRVLTMNKLVMKEKRGVLKAWYWYSVGNKFIDNYYFQQIYSLWNALRGKGYQGALIRVSVNGDNTALEIKAKEFIKELPSCLPWL